MSDNVKKRWFWSKNSEQGPPDLEEMIKGFFSKKKSNKDDGQSIYSKNVKQFEKPPIGKFIAIGIAVLIGLWVAFGFYIVQPAEKAAVLRLGEFYTIENSGLHWYPIGIDKILKENVEELKTESVQRDMLTSEENIVHVSFTVQYKISNLEDYLFANTNPTVLLQQSLESAVRQVIGESNLSDILTTQRAGITDKVRTEMVALLKTYKSGIYVSEVIMQPAQAPDAVKSAFDDVIKAKEDKERLQNDAEAYSNRVIPVAEGKSQRILDQANAYKQKVVLEAQGDIAQFTHLLPIYKQTPDIITNQIYFDTLSMVLKNNKVFIIDGDGAKNIFYGLDKSDNKALMSNINNGGK